VACHSISTSAFPYGKAQLWRTLYSIYLFACFNRPPSFRGPIPRSDHPLCRLLLPAEKLVGGEEPTQGMVTATAGRVATRAGINIPATRAESLSSSPLEAIIHLSLKTYQRGDRITICVSRGKVLRVTQVSVAGSGSQRPSPGKTW